MIYCFHWPDVFFRKGRQTLIVLKKSKPLGKYSPENSLIEVAEQLTSLFFLKVEMGLNILLLGKLCFNIFNCTKTTKRTHFPPPPLTTHLQLAVLHPFPPPLWRRTYNWHYYCTQFPPPPLTYPPAIGSMAPKFSSTPPPWLHTCNWQYCTRFPHSLWIDYAPAIGSIAPTCPHPLWLCACNWQYCTHFPPPPPLDYAPAIGSIAPIFPHPPPPPPLDYAPAIGSSLTLPLMMSRAHQIRCRLTRWQYKSHKRGKS